MNSIPVLMSVPYRNIEKILRGKLGDNGFRYLNSQSKGDISRLVMEQADAGNNLIVIAGGDTSIDEAVNAPVNLENLNFAVVPFGTANNFAKNIGMRSISDSCKLIKKISLGEINPNEYSMPTDLMQVSFGSKNIFYAASSLSIGLSALVCNKAEKEFEENPVTKALGKKASYYLAAISTMKDVVPSEVELSYVFEDGKTELATLENVIVVTVLNGDFFGSINWNPNACCFDKRFEVLAFEQMSFFKKLRLLTRMAYSNSQEHLFSDSNINGFNQHSIHYAARVKSVDVQVKRKHNDVCELIEVGGKIHIINPLERVRVEIAAEKTRFIYMPSEPKQPEGFTSWP
jgi:diacylglycerol kinase family enzyme